MEPYQEAAEATRRSGEIPLNALKFGATAAVGALGAKALSPVLNRIIPLLSNLIPDDLSKKGLAKVDPRFEKFINKAESQGWTYPEVKDFLSKKAKKTEKDISSENQKNVIEKYSPDLFRFLKDEIQKGRPPLQAAALAELPAKGRDFKKIISKMVKDNKSPWSSIVESVFGSVQQPKQENPIEAQAPLSAQAPQSNGASPQQQIPAQPQAQAPQSPAQATNTGGPGQQALMAILQKINQRLGS